MHQSALVYFPSLELAPLKVNGFSVYAHMFVCIIAQGHLQACD